MYRFVSSANRVELKNAYLKWFNVRLLENKLDNLMKVYPEIKDVLPDGMTAKKLLVGSFGFLTDVYWSFTTYLRGKSKTDRAAILKAFVDGGFNYNSHESKIRRFLMDSANRFEIHNCVYCDLEDVYTFTKADGKKVRQFETDHVLDKGECPLIALSLYNFVPSCGTCNGVNLKGTKTIGDTKWEVAHLSPSAEGYDFDGNVTFEVKMSNPNASDLKPETHPYDYEVGFIVRKQADFYWKSIELFELQSRYNHDEVKKVLLKWREMRRRYPDNVVKEFASIRMISYAEMFEDLFQLKLRKWERMEKARREVMLMKKDRL